MSVEILKSNLMQSKRIIEELALMNSEAGKTTVREEREFFESAVNALVEQLSMINNAIPNLLIDISVLETKEIKPLPSEAALYIPSGLVMLNKEDREKFLEELKISEEVLKRLKKRKEGKKAKTEEEYFKKSSGFSALSSKIFSKSAFKLAESAEFKKLNENLRKANMPYLISTYISIMLFSTLLVVITSLFLALFLSFFEVGAATGKPYPIVTFIGFAGIGLRLARNIFFSILASAATFWLFYEYPLTQVASISNKIKSELPFAIIHMSSIAGSGIEPSKIFTIIALSTEYPIISKEVKKIMNHINLYGYDLVTALKNVAKTTSSPELAELFSGIAVNIAGGGSLKDYLSKKAESTLVDYKLERRKYSGVAETSMDIYIGVLIAAPLIFMVLLIIMNVTKMSIGIGMRTLSYLIIMIIALTNVGFLIFLQFRQPA